MKFDIIIVRSSVDRMERKFLISANRLYKYILKYFWNGEALVGPDPGHRFELRFFRFIKNYFPSLDQRDKYYFLQCQGYWIRNNWDLFEISNNEEYRKVAIACSRKVLEKQKTDGSWEYPLKGWKKYVSTVEGTWASLGLIDTYKHTKNPVYLEGALRWYDFLIKRIGFQVYKDSLAINYFDIPKWRVPNNTTLTIWFFAELYKIMGDLKFLRFNDKMFRFIQLCQEGDGELRYTVEKKHYLCYHYNAFEFLDLYYSYEIIKDKRIRYILEKTAKFLSMGVTEIGSVKYDCLQTFPEKILHSGLIGAALICATSMGFKGYKKHIEYTYTFLLENQRSDGSFIHTRHAVPYFRKPFPYGFMTDTRSYPRALCYILNHLLIRVKSEIHTTNW